MREDFFGVGQLLLRMAREFSSQICHELRACDHPSLKASHALLIANLETSGTRISTLAERAEVTKQAMGQLVKEMETLGYVKREADPLDARATLIVPTLNGQKLLQDVACIAANIEAQHVEKIGRDELNHLRLTLLKWLE